MTLDFIWYKSRQTVKIGGVSRYKIRLSNSNPTRQHIFLRVKNLEKASIRAIHLLNGPFILYCHVVPANYSHQRRFSSGDSEDKEVCFRNSVKPGQTFNVRLALNDNSLVGEDQGVKYYEWECDVVSQIVLNRRAKLSFVLVIGDDLPKMRRVTRSTLTNLSKGDYQPSEHEAPDLGTTGWETQLHPDLSVRRFSENDIWTRKPPNPDKPVHLVILTHGIFSNLTADMLYLRDQLTNLTNENFIVEGYRENAGRTEKGIHRLGAGVSHYTTNLISDLQKDGYTIGCISFIGHSLGGPVQLYALKHILQIHGTDYFEKNGIRLRHFVCLASPMLGILSEMSLWISWFLDLGTLGKTGRDLTLLKKLPHISRNTDQSKHDIFRPVLETLPDEPVQTLLKSFDLRSVYANAVNDGIVPLRTSALLYLDWEALGDVNKIKEEHTEITPHESRVLTETNASGEEVGEIPDDDHSDIGSKLGKYLATSLNFNGSSAEGKEKKRKRVSKKFKRYAKINVKSSDTTEFDDEVDMESAASEIDPMQMNIPPKASAIESAFNSLICPIPSEKYITNPESRKPVIFHDKFYHFTRIPHEGNRKTGGLMKFFRYTDWRMDKQVKIARKYHAPELSWRKILVLLPPDAHNNIVVRRRFANGYGWGVIDHLTREIFDNGVVKPKI